MPGKRDKINFFQLPKHPGELLLSASINAPVIHGLTGSDSTGG